MSALQKRLRLVSFVRTGAFALWHVSCTGCLYWEPTYTGNALPELLRVDPPMNQPVSLDRDLIRFTVVSTDPEDEQLGFFWDTPPFAVGTPDNDEVDGVYFSLFDLEVGPGLAGDRLTLIITDDGEDDPVILTLDWDLEAN